jgi:hypothetical protein
MTQTTQVAPVTGWNLSSIPGCVAKDPCEDLAFFTTFPYSCMKLEAASPEERYEVSLSPLSLFNSYGSIGVELSIQSLLTDKAD